MALSGWLGLVLSAVLVHAVFRRCEPWSPIVHAGLLGVVPCATLFALCLPMVSGLLAFWAAVFASVVAYRLSPLHPLAHIPGPWLERVSMLRMAAVSAGGRRHAYVRELHAHYGPFVRIGPNAVSVADKDAVKVVYGPASAWQRSINYDSGKNKAVGSHVLNERDVARHAARRRVWARAFSPAALRGYAPDVVRRAEMLADALNGRGADAIDILPWLSRFAFDVMGDLAFGGGFDTLLDEDTQGFIRTLNKGVRFGTISGNLPWLTPYLASLPAPDDFQKIFRFARTRLDWRRSQPKGLKHDIFHYLSGEDGHDAPPEPELLADTALLLVAGADTTAAALAALFYHVLSDTASYDRLQAEVDAIPVSTQYHCAVLPFLDAVIYETLRITPPVPSGGRRSPADGTGGEDLCGWFIPEGTAVTVNPFSMQRRAEYFPNPDTFDPARWLGERSSKVDVDACIPFLAGNTSCIGRQLAIQELRIAVCTLMRRFHMTITPECTDWLETIEDFTMTRGGPLKVHISRREL